jgi:hypothetical protein
MQQRSNVGSHPWARRPAGEAVIERGGSPASDRWRGQATHREQQLQHDPSQKLAMASPELTTRSACQR